MEARYAYQVWDLSIPLEGEEVEDDAALARLIESFHDVLTGGAGAVSDADPVVAVERD